MDHGQAKTCREDENLQRFILPARFMLCNMPRRDIGLAAQRRAQPPPCARRQDSRCRRMAGNTEFVSLRIPEVRAIVVRVILRPQAGRSFRCASVGKSDCEGSIHDGSALREERDHLAVARLVKLPVEGRANEEEGPRAGM